MASKGSKVRGRKGKIGKNKHRIAAYYGSGRYEWNKARGIIHHMQRYGFGDQPASETLKALLAAMPLHLGREFKAAYWID